MAFNYGSKAVFKIDDSGNVLRDVSTYLTSAGVPRAADTGETSALGGTSKAYIAGLIDGTFALEGLWDPTVDGYLAGILGNDSVGAALPDYEYGPAGSTGGFVKYTGKFILTAYEVQTPVDGPATFSAEGQLSGTQTRTTW